MTRRPSFTVRPIGVVHSPITSRANAPRQGAEGAPDAWIELDPSLVRGLTRMRVGMELIVLTWLHRARRDVLRVRPRSDRRQRLAGVFATRSPDRPNPIGVHRVTLREVEGARLLVGPIEAIDGTPVIDIKYAMPNY
ncbi:MAG TPA: tRNA (N6-threonylcarbamoyladenosine(37)-N6)-methyltransferase TrmO [Gemmatimonadales bacterium]|nr:tRNA (N6-threonylcarbamoyladenosine(37)-N6)-methyltransferase TrmO [Gemmatimonadales bacterium]